MTSRSPLVMHVIPGLGSGGAEHMLATLVTAHRREPYRQVVVDTLGGGQMAERIRAAGVEVIDLNAHHPALLPLAVVRLARLIRRMRPEAIQSWLYYGDLTAYGALQLSGRRAATRLYWGIRCSDMDLRRYRWMLRRTISTCARLSDRPDAVIANSFAGREIHRQLGYHPRVFPVIPNGIDTTRFRPDEAAHRRIREKLGITPEQPVVIHVARVDPMKDHANLLAVARELPWVTFMLVGSRTNALKVPANVRALGARSDMPALYAAADLAVSTSAFGEGFSNAIAEAMASGLPVVSTDVGDARTIVGDSGFIVPPGSSAATKAAVERILREPVAERRARGLASRRHIEDTFSLERAVATFDSLFIRGTCPDN